MFTFYRDKQRLRVWCLVERSGGPQLPCRREGEGVRERDKRQIDRGERQRERRDREREGGVIQRDRQKERDRQIDRERERGKGNEWN